MIYKACAAQEKEEWGVAARRGNGLRNLMYALLRGEGEVPGTSGGPSAALRGTTWGQPEEHVRGRARDVRED